MHMARVSMIVFGAMALVDQLIIQINISKGGAFTTALHTEDLQISVSHLKNPFRSYNLILKRKPLQLTCKIYNSNNPLKYKIQSLCQNLFLKVPWTLTDNLCPSLG